MKKPAQTRILYVSVRDPATVRKDVLTSARQVLSALRKHEEYKLIREQKAQLTGDLKRTMDQIRVLSSRLRNLLPQQDVKLNIPVRIRNETNAQVQLVEPITRRERPQQDTRVQQLERELADIEKTLSALEN